MCTINFMIGLHEKFTFLPLHIRNVSKGLIRGKSSNLETAITWSLAGCVAISLSCVPSKCGPIPTLSIRTPRSLRTRDGATISSPDDVVARTKSSWGILVLPLFLNHVVFKPVKLEPTTKMKKNPLGVYVKQPRQIFHILRLSIFEIASFKST